ncbi:MAG: hypothetical protein Q8M94_15840 [Ignavibacteria bacterium]|nr:hypothetical protein [Ignavibacteria bacterium]
MSNKNFDYSASISHWCVQPISIIEEQKSGQFSLCKNSIDEGCREETSNKIDEINFLKKE